jgi:glycosyltransferase involved in cell wall biosynthesis
VSDLVSVIIPTYNRQVPVLDAIASVQRQTHRDIEIIVVDDGSTDETALRVAALGNDVTYVAQEHAGQGAARTRGLAMAAGEFIGSLDSDDVWQPNFVERSLDALRRLELDFVFSNWHRAGAGQAGETGMALSGLEAYECEIDGDWRVLAPAEVRRMFLDSCPATSSALLMRRSSMPNAWNSQMMIADDWYLLFEMSVARRSRAAYTATPLWTKRVDGSNIYDGRPPRHVVRTLYRHDHRRMQRDFRARLSMLERARLSGSRLRWVAILEYARLRGCDAVNGERSSAS